MNDLSLHIGKKIKLLRKIKNMTLEDFSKKINKSVATISKYENGNISIDIETLFNIAEALDADITQLIDYSYSMKRNKKILPNKSIFGNNDILYMYFYDGIIRKIISSIIHLNYNVSKSIYEATLYMDIDSYDNIDSCKYLYFGEFKPFDSISNFQLENQSNNIEQMNITIINPLSTTSVMIGLVLGIVGYPFLPSASKVIMSRKILTIDDDLIGQLKFTKQEVANIKKLNRLIIAKTI